MLVDDLAEVVNRVTSVARPSVCVAEATSRIARIGNVCPIPIGNINAPQANCIQRQEDVAPSQVNGVDVNSCRIRLIEDVEQSGPELKLLRLGDIEVLEE